MPLLVSRRILLLVSLNIFSAINYSRADQDKAAEPTTAAEIYGQGVRETDARSPENEQAGFHLPDGFEVQLFAAEPQIAKPLNMAWDTRGRLWITNTIEYPYPAKEGSVPRDSIKILEDTDGDGRADKITTFADNLNIPMGLLPTKGGVICFNIPDIVFLRDNDGDDHCDERIKLLGPFDTTRDTHGMINALRRGPDGWIYACHGFNNQSHVTAADGSQVKLMSGNTFRFREDGSRIEQFTQGQVNPFGMTTDEWGNRYTADCHSKPITALLPGGCYPSFGRPHDGLGFAPSMMDHLHGSTAICGLVYYQAEQFPEPFRHRFYSGNVMTSRINCNAIERRGATVSARELPDFMTSDDPWFRPVDIQLGPDGGLYVADFYNKIIGHYEVPLTHPGRDRDSGRIWKIVYRGSDKPLPQSLTDYGKQIATSDILGDAHLQELSSANLTRCELAVERARESDLTTAQITRVRKLLLDEKSPERLRLSCLAILSSRSELSAIEIEQLLKTTSPRLLVESLRAASQPGLTAADGLLVAVRRVLEHQEPQVQLATITTLGQVGSAADVRSLLKIAQTQEASDPTLRQAARIAARNLLRDEQTFAVLAKGWRLQSENSPPTRMEIRINDPLASELVSILPALDSELAAEALLSYVDAHSAADLELVQASIAGAAKHLNTQMTEALLRVVRKINGDDPVALAKMLDAVCVAVIAKNLPYPAALQKFGIAAAGKLRQEIERTLAESDTLSDWRDARGADWGSEQRKCQDGQTMTAVSSLTRGEAYTGTLVSSPFACPAEFEFWLCGHNGLPTTPDHQKNLVRLVDIQTGQPVQSVYPPRNDTAKQVRWNLADSVGRQVRLELIDADNGSAYAWLAIGRCSVRGLNPTQIGEQLNAFSLIVRRHISDAVTQEAQPILTSGKLSPRMRGQLIANIAEAQSRSLLQALAEQALEIDQAALITNELVHDDVNIRKTASDRVLQQISLAVTARQQAAFAGRLVRSGEGCAALVQLLDSGKLSLAAMRGRDGLLPENCPADVRARLMELAKQASQLPEDNTKIVQERLAKLNLESASLDQGKLLFEKSCALCHQLGGKGTLIGPQLDGAGRRGAERLCEDILDPHRNVDKAFRTSTLLLQDDKVVNGLVREQADGSLQVVGQDGKAIIVAADVIDQRRDSEKSLMPDNFAELLSDSDLAALLKYLTAAR